MALYLKLIKTLALLVGGLYALRFCIGLFSKRQSTFTVDIHRQFSLLFWSILSLLVIIPLLGALISTVLLPLELVFLLVAVMFLLSFSLPSFFLHFQYWRQNRNLLIEVDKRNESFKVYNLIHKNFYPKEKIIRTTYIRCRSRQYFWSKYEYLIFEMVNGDKITITSLLLPLDQLIRFLPAKTIQMQTKTICWL
ncbi:hypothetical protein AHMF7605_22000 [Adhaeribacter arboris]|uniref:PH domain-containing protein n=1 Tax=Adhaeribacter arboris TaxID=2072846 RepID=A0A2T2YKF1_9BACT|nr:hypothetical protein [Adhaeribacter arboris]PSR55978.1 hypothetical protein AHMF7605_22000 [Adhaeribacter arboris]